MSDVPLIELRNVFKIYGEYGVRIKALDDVSLKIYEKEFVAVTGPSGSGKSTMLNCMGLLDRPSSGEVLIDGANVNKMPGKKVAALRGKKIGFIFQTYNLISRLTAMENVILPGVVNGEKKELLNSRAIELMKEVDVLHRAKHKAAHLSGGEQQKVAIARAFINSPCVILGDEPTEALDTKNSENIMSILKKMNETHGVATVFVTHDLSQTKCAKRIIELRDGKIIGDQRGGTGNE